MNGYGAKGALKSMFPRVAWRQYLLSPFSDFCGGGLCPLVSVFLSLSLSFPWDLGQLSPLGAILGSWDYCFVSSHLVIVGKGPPRVPTPLISIFSSRPPLPSFLHGVVCFFGRKTFISMGIFHTYSGKPERNPLHH